MSAPLRPLRVNHGVENAKDYDYAMQYVVALHMV